MISKRILFCFICLFIINSIFGESIDGSKYNDAATIEFGLHDKKGNYFCLYHNVNNIKNFDTKNYDVVAQWGHAKWVKKDKEKIIFNCDYE